MMHIIYDSREQQPFFKLKPPHPTMVMLGTKFSVFRRGLNVGDYTTTNLLFSFAIERKSLQDLYGTIVQRHPAFRREILRAEKQGIKLVVVVEGTHNQFINKKFPYGDRRKTSSETLKKIIRTIKDRYELEFIFCKDRADARIKTLKRLIYEERKLSKKSI